MRKDDNENKKQNKIKCNLRLTVSIIRKQTNKYMVFNDKVYVDISTIIQKIILFYILYKITRTTFFFKKKKRHCKHLNQTLTYTANASRWLLTNVLRSKFSGCPEASRVQYKQLQSLAYCKNPYFYL